MTTTNLTRRTAVLGTVTLPAALAPAAALGIGEIPQWSEPAENDPAVAAFEEWWPLMQEYVKAAEREGDDWTEEEINAVHDRELEAMLALADAVPTTPEGMVCKLRCAFYIFGDPDLGGDYTKTEDYEIEGFGFDQGRRMLTSLLKGAESMSDEGRPV